MPGSSRTRGHGNRESKPHVAVQKHTGVSPGPPCFTGRLRLSPLTALTSVQWSPGFISQPYCHKRIQRHVFHNFLTLRELNPHLLYVIILSYAFSLLYSQIQKLVKDSWDWGRNESKRDSSIAILIAQSSKGWLTNGTRLSSCSKRITCFYKDLVTKNFTISPDRPPQIILCLLSTGYSLLQGLDFVFLPLETFITITADKSTFLFIELGKVIYYLELEAFRRKDLFVANLYSLSTEITEIPRLVSFIHLHYL